MSNIPKSKRKESSLECVHLAYKIHRRITGEIFLSFHYNPKKLETITKEIEVTTNENKNISLDEHKLNQKIIYGQISNENNFFLQRRRDEIIRQCESVIYYVTAANTIYPTWKCEFDLRRKYLDKALVCCNLLQINFCLMAEYLPTDANKYCDIVKDIRKEFNMIKALRKSDNRFLNKLHDWDKINDSKNKQKNKYK